jgi:hypothetical protein
MPHSGIELQTGTSIDQFALPFHFHDSYQFDVMLEGSRSYRLRGGVHTGAPGWLCVIHPAEGHAVRLASETCSFRTMNVDPERLRQACEEITGHRDLPTFDFGIRDEATVKLFLAAHRMVENGDPFEADCVLTAFLGNLVARHAGSRGGLPGTAGHARLRLACRYIEAHLSRKYFSGESCCRYRHQQVLPRQAVHPGVRPSAAFLSNTPANCPRTRIARQSAGRQACIGGAWFFRPEPLWPSFSQGDRPHAGRVPTPCYGTCQSRNPLERRELKPEKARGAAGVLS